MENQQMNLPEGWVIKPLGRIIQEVSKSPLQVSDATNFGEFPFFTSGEDILKHNHALIEGQHIFLATGGVANVKYFEGKASYSTDTYAITTTSDVEPKYLYFYILNILYYINANYFLGSGLKHLQKKDFKQHSVFFPKSIQEQQKIASILSKIDEAIAHTEALIAKYEQIKTGLMQDLLTRGIDEHGRIRTEQTHPFKDSPLGRIPQEWEVKEIGEIAEQVRSGITPRGGSEVYQKEGVMLIRSQNVYPDGLKLDDVAYISENINNTMLGSQLKEYDILLNITGASIGRCYFIPSNFPKANVNQHVCSIRLTNTSLAKALFVTGYLNSPKGQNQIFQNNAGSNREGINYQKIREIQISYPMQDDEFKNFANAYFKITKQQKPIKTELTKLLSLKSGLMQDLLSGRVRV